MRAKAHFVARTETPHFPKFVSRVSDADRLTGTNRSFNFPCALFSHNEVIRLIANDGCGTAAFLANGTVVLNAIKPDPDDRGVRSELPNYIR